MSAPIAKDPLLQALAALPQVQADATRAEAVRARCRDLLEQADPPRDGQIGEVATLAATCGLYGWQLARLAALLWR